jgi:RNA polymerase sigma factor (sigma-70 family)
LISYLRSQKRHENVVLLEDSSDEEQEFCDDDDPAKRLVEEESYLALSRRIHDALSPFENQIWWLYLSGRTAGEIAEQLGTNEKAVQNAVYRIRKKLRAVIPCS